MGALEAIDLEILLGLDRRPSPAAAAALLYLFARRSFVLALLAGASCRGIHDCCSPLAVRWHSGRRRRLTGLGPLGPMHFCKKSPQNKWVALSMRPSHRRRWVSAPSAASPPLSSDITCRAPYYSGPRCCSVPPRPSPNTRWLNRVRSIISTHQCAAHGEETEVGVDYMALLRNG